MFEVIKKSKKSKARIGKITTKHGIVFTPAFVPVATKGTIKSLSQNFIENIGIQVVFVNTYHLVNHPGIEVLEKFGGIHNFANFQIPLMSDSGGFQVFSLANKKKARLRNEEIDIVVKILEEGVIFKSNRDGKEILFTPEKSIEYQIKIGADLIMAFDECTTYPTTYDYAQKSLERTHNWLIKCLNYFKKNKKEYQSLYGIIQGSIFKDLRKKSAKFITSQNVDGIAIGGVSVGETKKEMRTVVKFVSEFLPQNKPVHLLGVGRIDDIVDLITYGIDTFDCVEPTRIARTGHIYQIKNEKNLKKYLRTIDIKKNIYKDSKEKVDPFCPCYICKNFTKAYLHHLFKEKEITAYILATYHNLFLMEQLFKKIRKTIKKGEI